MPEQAVQECPLEGQNQEKVFDGTHDYRVEGACSANAPVAMIEKTLDMPSSQMRDALESGSSVAQSSDKTSVSKPKKSVSFLSDELLGIPQSRLNDLTAYGLVSRGASRALYHGHVKIGASHPIVINLLRCAAQQPGSTLDATKLALFIKEVKLLDILIHPGVPRFLGWLAVNIGGSLELGTIMELCQAQSVHSLLNSREPLPWLTRIVLLQDYADCILSLHNDSQIVHGNINSENLLAHWEEEGTRKKCKVLRGKIVDFQRARPIQSTTFDAIQGSSDEQPRLDSIVEDRVNLHQPPEVWANREYTTKSDVYSFGVVMWMLMTGKEYRIPDLLIRHQVHNSSSTDLLGNLHPPDMLANLQQSWGGPPPDKYVPLMKKCWAKSPDNRPSFEEIRRTLGRIFEDLNRGQRGGRTSRTSCASLTSRIHDGRWPQHTGKEIQEAPWGHGKIRKTESIQELHAAKPKKKQGGLLGFLCKCYNRSTASETSSVQSPGRSLATKATEEPVSQQCSPVSDSQRDCSSGNVSDAPLSESDHPTPILNPHPTDIEMIQRFPPGPASWGKIHNMLRRAPDSPAWDNVKKEAFKVKFRPSSNQWDKFVLELLRSPAKEVDWDQWSNLYHLATEKVPATDLRSLGWTSVEVKDAMAAILSIQAKGPWIISFQDLSRATPVLDLQNGCHCWKGTCSGIGNVQVHEINTKLFIEVVRGNKLLSEGLKAETRRIGVCRFRAEGLVDALLEYHPKEILQWAFLREAERLYKCLPKECTFKGICLDNLSVVSSMVPDSFVPLQQLLRQENVCWGSKLDMAQIIAGFLLELHKRSVFHLVLGSPLIYFDDQLEIKVDMGYTRFADAAVPLCDCRWVAPEVLIGQKPGPYSDIYSLGLILWELLSSKVPWEGLDPLEVTIATIGSSRLEISGDWSASFVDIIKMCWSHNPASRPSAHEVLIMLEAQQEMHRSRKPAPTVDEAWLSDLAVLDNGNKLHVSDSVLGWDALWTVYKGKMIDADGYGKEVAVKAFKNDTARTRDIVQVLFESSSSVLQSVDNPNVVKFLGASSHKFLVMELYSSDLKKLIYTDMDFKSRATFKDLLEIFLGITLALKYLHEEQGVVHHDLKPSHVLLSEDGTPKLTGFSKISSKQPVQATYFGSECYMAPEVALAKPPYTPKGKHVVNPCCLDIFSFGIVMWECVMRCDPMAMRTADNNEQSIEVSFGSASGCIPCFCPETLQELIQDCLYFDILAWNKGEMDFGRPSLSEIERRLQEMLVKRWVEGRPPAWN